MAGTRDIVQVPVDGSGKKLDSFSYDLADGRGTTYANTSVLVDSAGHDIDSLSLADGTYALEVATAGTEFMLSPTTGGNSSTSQLTASSTFTGTWESVWNQQTVTLLICTDQTLTIHVQQAITANVNTLTSDWTYTVTAGSTGWSRAFSLAGNYFRITATNTSGTTATTTLNINTAYGTLPASTTLGNVPVAMNEVAGADMSTLAFAYFNTAAQQTGTSLIAAPAAGKSLRVISYAVMAGGAVTFSLIGPTTTILLPFSVNGGLSFAGSLLGPAFQVAPATALTYTTNGAVQISGHIAYVIV